jgi:hypothetical protein
LGVSGLTGAKPFVILPGDTQFEIIASYTFQGRTLDARLNEHVIGFTKGNAFFQTAVPATLSDVDGLQRYVVRFAFSSADWSLSLRVTAITIAGLTPDVLWTVYSDALALPRSFTGGANVHDLDERPFMVGADWSFVFGPLGVPEVPAVAPTLDVTFTLDWD